MGDTQGFMETIRRLILETSPTNRTHSLLPNSRRQDGFQGDVDVSAVVGMSCWQVLEVQDEGCVVLDHVQHIFQLAD